MKTEQDHENESDAELLSRFCAGNAVAMDRLVMRYQQPLFAWLMGMTRNHADADDLFQEIWVRIIRHAEKFTNVSFRAWMWKIARNAWIDFQRKRRATVSLDKTDDEDSAPLVDLLPSADAGPARRMERADLMRRVKQAVSALPDVQREVFLLRTDGDLSFQEIAELLQIPLNTALGRMHDAMAKLKKTFASEM